MEGFVAKWALGWVVGVGRSRTLNFGGSGAVSPQVSRHPLCLVQLHAGTRGSNFGVGGSGASCRVWCICRVWCGSRSAIRSCCWSGARWGPGGSGCAGLRRVTIGIHHVADSVHATNNRIVHGGASLYEQGVEHVGPCIEIVGEKGIVLGIGQADGVPYVGVGRCATIEQINIMCEIICS